MASRPERTGLTIRPEVTRLFLQEYGSVRPSTGGEPQFIDAFCVQGNLRSQATLGCLDVHSSLTEAGHMTRIALMACKGLPMTDHRAQGTRVGLEGRNAQVVGEPFTNGGG